MEEKQTLQTEVGGSHYKDNYIIQPVELITICEWDFIQGNIAKYVLRYKYKNGLEDLKKADHYCYMPKITADYKKLHTAATSMFCRVNNITDPRIKCILVAIDRRDFMHAAQYIEEIIDKEYGGQNEQ